MYIKEHIFSNNARKLFLAEVLDLDANFQHQKGYIHRFKIIYWSIMQLTHIERWKAAIRKNRSLNAMNK
jgi:hypothetical protein